MKKIITLFVALLFAGAITQAQVLIVKWTFPTGNATDSIADGGIPANLNKAIDTGGGTSDIDFSKNGATTKAAQATGWDNGAFLKYWVVEVCTQGYDNLRLSSKMQSGGNNPGPRDFTVQYRIGGTDLWIDIPGTTIVTANDWSTGWLDSVVMPSGCYNQSELYLRWIMTTNNNSQGGVLTSGGINKIDDIYVTGKQMNTGIRETQRELPCMVSPNPSNGNFVVEATESITSVSMFNTGGKCVYTKSALNAKKVTLKVDTIPQGTYFLKIRSMSGKEGNQKIVISH
jgi:hypothetical protein